MICASWAIFFTFLVGAAWLGAQHQDGFGWAVAHDAAQAVAAAALALGGLGSVWEWRQRRRWSSAIQVITVDLLNSLLRDIGAVMSRTAQVLLSDRSAARQLDYVFQLPWTTESERRVDVWLARSTARSLEIIKADDFQEMLSRLQENVQELAARNDHLRDAAVALEGYIQGDHAMPLLEQVSRLHRRVQILLDLAGSADVVHPAQIVAAAGKVLRSGKGVAAAIRIPFDLIRSEVEDPELQRELDANEWAIAETHAVESFTEAAAAAAREREKVEERLAEMQQRWQQTQARAALLQDLPPQS